MSDISSHHILLVDDNEAIHEDIKSLLCPSEHAVVNKEKLDALEERLFGQQNESSRPNNIAYLIDDAFQGEEALRKVEQATKDGNPYSVIFMDVRMPPGMDGVQTTKKIWERFPDVQVVICTAYSDYSLEEIHRNLGDTDKLLFMHKPLDASSVRQAARTLNNKWKIEQENKRYTQSLEEQVEARTADLQKTVSELHESRKKEIAEQEEKMAALERLQTTQKQLIEAEKMAALGNLVVGVAHEMNTPIGTGITGITSIIRDTEETEALLKTGKLTATALKTYLEQNNNACHIVKNTLEKAASLIKQFKQLGVTEKNYNKAEFNLGDTIRLAAHNLYEQLKQSNVRLRVRGEPYLTIESFPEAIIKITSALVSNSLVHGFTKGLEGKAGKIEIDYSLIINGEDASLNFVYKDNGKGVEPEQIGRVFEPFFTTQRSSGTGLGLHIVYIIVSQLLNGTIAFHSDGDGVVVSIAFPIRIKSPS